MISVLRKRANVEAMIDSWVFYLVVGEQMAYKSEGAEKILKKSMQNSMQY